MKISLLKYSLCLSVLSLLTACSSTEVTSDDHDVGVPLTVCANIEGTRAAITGNTFAKGDSIGIFAVNADGNEYHYGSMNMKALCSEGNVCSFAEGSVYLMSAPATVYAYYPYARTNSTTTVPVDIAPDATGSQTDFLYGSGNASVNCVQPVSSITFHHALARLTLSILRSKTGTGNGYLTDMTLCNLSPATALSLQGNMDIRTGTITPVTDTYATLALDVKKTLSTTVPVTVDAMLIPVTIDKNVELVLNIDNRFYRITLPTLTLVAGKQTVLPINVDF